MSKQNDPASMDVQAQLQADVVHLVRMGLAGRSRDVQLHARRMSRAYEHASPSLSADLVAQLRRSTPESPLRAKGVTQFVSPIASTQAGGAPTPVDNESRLALLKLDYPTSSVRAPVLPTEQFRALQRIVDEHARADALEAAGLTPTRSLLLTGPPGVGKTLVATWLATQLAVPLLTLDLAAVMSSFLGRTGNNIRAVLEHAKSQPCVLLLDEFDAIAKRRDDAAEVGELKRLVTVLLQELDTWPPGSLLVAATNHPNLLDPAIWRRFEVHFSLGLPGRDLIAELIDQFVETGIESTVLDAFVEVSAGWSPADIERQVMQARKASVMDGTNLSDELLRVIGVHVTELDRDTRTLMATSLVASGRLSQRRANQIFHVSRDKLRSIAAQL